MKMSVMSGSCSSQEETDTRIILYITYAQSKGYHYARVSSPDLDFSYHTPLYEHVSKQNDPIRYRKREKQEAV